MLLSCLSLDRIGSDARNATATDKPRNPPPVSAGSLVSQYDCLIIIVFGWSLQCFQETIADNTFLYEWMTPLFQSVYQNCRLCIELWPQGQENTMRCSRETVSTSDNFHLQLKSRSRRSKWHPGLRSPAGPSTASCPSPRGRRRNWWGRLKDDKLDVSDEGDLPTNSED